jgi:glycerophosphoryl diester phosphodiesterase
MREAARQGARGVEFDAKLASDGVVILMHDDTLDRTTDGRGAAAEVAASRMAQLDAGAWFGERWAGARVPTLEETLLLLLELDLYPNIEIKPCPGREAVTARAVVEVVQRTWPAERQPPLLSSFAFESMAVARDLAPELPRGLLIEGVPPDWAEQAHVLACRSLHCWHEDMSPGWAGAIRAADLIPLVYTVNDAAAAHRLFDWGVWSVVTDRPGALLAGLARQMKQGEAIDG